MGRRVNYYLPPDRKMTQFLRNFLVGTHLPIVGTNLLIFPMIKNNIHFLKTQILWKSKSKVLS